MLRPWQQVRCGFLNERIQDPSSIPLGIVSSKSSQLAATSAASASATSAYHHEHDEKEAEEEKEVTVQLIKEEARPNHSCPCLPHCFRFCVPL